MITARDRLAALVEVLYERTLEGQVDWTLRSDPSTIAALVGHNTIALSEETEQFENSIRITIYNTKGAEVDTFNDTLFSDMMPKRVKGNTYYSVMSNLIESARRKATGADQVLDDILSALGSPPIVEAKLKNSFSPNFDDDVPF